MSRPVTGTTHHVPFYSAIAPTSGYTIFTITNGNLTQPVSTAVLSSLVLSLPLGSGYYQFEYIPDVPGYYLFAANPATSVNIIEGVDIDQADSYVDLTQSTPPGLVPNVINPQNYILMIFLSSDWQVGRYKPLYAVASTQLDSQGNWLSTPLTVIPGTYHVVVQANNGVQVVIAAFLKV